MNLEERTATLNGEEISLTVREFDILFKMLSYPKKTFTRSALTAELNVLKGAEHNDGIDYAYRNTNLIERLLGYRKSNFNHVLEPCEELF